MTSQEAKELITPNFLNFGVVKDKSKLPFTLNNLTGTPIHGFTKSCGCVGTVNHNDDKLWGEIEASYKPNQVQDVFLVDGKYCLEIPTPGSGKFITILDKQLIENPTEITSVKATKFEQSITLRFKDGKEAEKRNESGELVENPDRLKVVIPINFYVTV